MNFDRSERETQWLGRVRSFISAHVVPAQALYQEQMQACKSGEWTIPPVIDALKTHARAAGLWNLFMPPIAAEAQVDSTFNFDSPGLTNLEYAACAEEMGRIGFASEAFNCSAPDSGNMEVLHRYATREQKERWLEPLMNGVIRSSFLMTEPAVASSDATNIETLIRRDGDQYVITGRKWWASGIGDPRCALCIVMGKTDPSAAPHRQQSMILVPLNSVGLTVLRLLPVFGYDGAPHGHGEVSLDEVRVPVTNLLLGEGRGFEIAQGRLGPGRLHHCMRSIGVAEVALEKMTRRLLSRRVFGKPIAEHSVWEERIARARIDIEMTRLLCLKAADAMDKGGNTAARLEIAMIKAAAPRMATRIIDDAIQAFGGAGVTSDAGLAHSYAEQRALRLADGPDEVHNRTIARLEYSRYVTRTGRA